MIKKNKAIILMSGGLDSLVALDSVEKANDIDVCLALTFDYGQKALKHELKASKNICEHYKIKHEVIKLEWLKKILDEMQYANDNLANPLWIPNRNSLFLNIAASFCDANGYHFIIYGANADEAKKFSDNTLEFTDNINELFKTSTIVGAKVLAPLINYSKDDIVRIAVGNKVPLQLIYSCYGSSEKHCGKCESCNYLKKALENNGCYEYIDILFEKK